MLLLWYYDDRILYAYYYYKQRPKFTTSDIDDGLIFLKLVSIMMYNIIVYAPEY